MQVLIWLPMPREMCAVMHWARGTLDVKTLQWLRYLERECEESGLAILTLSVNSPALGMWPRGNGTWPLWGPQHDPPDGEDDEDNQEDDEGENMSMSCGDRWQPPGWQPPGWQPPCWQPCWSHWGRECDLSSTECLHEVREFAQSTPPTAAKGTGGKGKDDPVPELGPADIPDLSLMKVPVIHFGRNIGKV